MLPMRYPSVQRPSSLLFALLLVVLTPCTSAQELDISDAPPILVLETGDRGNANFVVQICGGEPRVEPAEAGEFYRVSVSVEGDAKIDLVDALDCVLRVSVDPDQIYGLLDEAVGPLRVLIRGVVWNLLSSEGMEPRTIRKLLRQVDRFPRQIKRIDLEIRGDKSDLAIDLSLHPKPSTWLQRAISGLNTSDGGAHLLRSPGAWFSIALAVQGDGVAMFADPIADLYAEVRGREKAERQAFRHAVAKRMELYDGRLSLLWVGRDRFTRLIGVRDGERYTELSKDPELQRFDLARLGELPAQLLQPSSRRLRQAGVVRILTRSEAVAREALEEYAANDEDRIELETLAKIVGDYSIVAHGPSDGAAFGRLLRRVEAGRVRPMKLLGGALASGEIHPSLIPIGLLPESLESQLAQAYGMTEDELLLAARALAPKLILFEFRRDGDVLQLQIRGR